MLNVYKLSGNLRNSFNQCAKNPDYMIGQLLDDAIEDGIKDSRDLADLLYFLFHHDDDNGKLVPIKPHETEKIKEWNGWREIAKRRLKHGPGKVTPRSKESEEASRAARIAKIIKYLNNAPISKLRKTYQDGVWMKGVRDVLVMALQDKPTDTTYPYFRWSDTLELNGSVKRSCAEYSVTPGNLHRSPQRRDAYSEFVKAINDEPITTPEAVNKILKRIHEKVHCPTSLMWRWYTGMGGVSYSKLNLRTEMQWIREELARAKKPNSILHPYLKKLRAIVKPCKDLLAGTPFTKGCK